MTKIVQHPRRDEGLARNLPRKIAASRAQAITDIQQVIDTLTRVFKEPGYEFAGEFVREFMFVRVYLEALDPATPPSAAQMRALGRQLENAWAVLLERIMKEGRSAS